MAALSVAVSVLSSRDTTLLIACWLLPCDLRALCRVSRTLCPLLRRDENSSRLWRAHSAADSAGYRDDMRRLWRRLFAPRLMRLCPLLLLPRRRRSVLA